MINPDEIKKYFPEVLQKNPIHIEFMLKEYFHYKILNVIFNSKWAGKLCLIGGTCIRILHNINRFSEDLDFDSFNLERDEFMELTDEVIRSLSLEGLPVRADDKEKDMSLNAFRRNLVFPGLMYDLKLSGHREKKFLIKIESEPHGFAYIPDRTVIQKFNVFTHIFAAPADILLAMKTATVLERQKGRDFYDFIFLSGKTEPNLQYLEHRFGIKSSGELYQSILERIENVDFNLRSKDFEKLVFDRSDSEKVRLFPEFIRQKLGKK